MLNSTIVSMTDSTGKTGNVDYRDCRIPTDKDLVEASNHYGLTGDIKFTITDSVGNKRRFTAKIVKGKLILNGTPKVSTSALTEICKIVTEQEISKLSMYMDFAEVNDETLQSLGISTEMVQRMVAEKKHGIWRYVPARYEKAMFNCVLTEFVTDKLARGEL